jgi:hypothetical protein
MKNLIPILLLLTMLSCSKKSEHSNNENVENGKPEMTDKEFNEKLVKAGFFKYAEPTVNINLIDSLNIYDENTNKFSGVDAEELAEFNFDHFVPQLTKMLARRNITLSVEKSKDIEKNHEVSINEQKIVLYTQEELQNESFWDSGSRNFFKKLNKILEAKNSEERFYLLYKGNDLATFLLTNAEYELFKDRYKSESNEIPYEP